MLKSEIRVPPARAFIQPAHGDNWESIATRVLPETPVQDAVQQLVSWNLFLAFRPGGGVITPSDIVFIEAPRAASAAA